MAKSPNCSRCIATLMATLFAFECVAEIGLERDALVYSRSVSEACEVGLWYPSAKAPITLLQTDDCPGELFISGRIPTLFIVDNESIVSIELDGRFRTTRLAKAPELDFMEYIDDVESKPHPETMKMMYSTIMKVRTLGFTDDGTLALHAALEGPAGGSFEYLLKHNSGKWNVVEYRGCDNWELNCRFKSLPGISASMWEWGEQRLVWHPSIADNPYFVRDQDERDTYQGEVSGLLVRHFNIANSKTALRIITSPSAHYDTSLTFGVVIELENDEIVICNEQCRATISGQYLLAQRFWGGTLEVYDMQNGRSVLGELVNATWVDLPAKH